MMMNDDDVNVMLDAQLDFFFVEIVYNIRMYFWWGSNKVIVLVVSVGSPMARCDCLNHSLCAVSFRWCCVVRSTPTTL